MVGRKNSMLLTWFLVKATNGLCYYHTALLCIFKAFCNCKFCSFRKKKRLNTGSFFQTLCYWIWEDTCIVNLLSEYQNSFFTKVASNISLFKLCQESSCLLFFVIFFGQDKGFEDAKQVIAALNSQGISSVGAAGFCWGGKTSLISLLDSFMCLLL